MASKLEQSELYGLKALRGVSLDSVEELLGTCELRRLAPGDVLLTLGQPNDTMYMILSGELSIHLEGPTSEAVATLGPGETVGELSVIDQSPASAYVVAAEPTRLLAIDEPRFWNLVNASHDFAINLLLSLAKRLRANNSTVSTNIKLQREYKRNALIDGLTGLYNRRWIDEALPRFVQRYGRGGQPLTVLMIDVDHFKRFNDTYGHAMGDQVLVRVGQALRASLRPTDHVARYGGEEFLVILPDTVGDAAEIVANRLRTAVSDIDLVQADGTAIPRITISLGGGSLRSGQTMKALLGHADEALYQSKANGRDRVTFAVSSS
ncbi:MAG TPA: GGDEF domain-containing protein [Kofleriaceae bacterium]|nr:GGDEF domain-containing protein [Kofleriaceae bacterium]